MTGELSVTHFYSQSLPAKEVVKNLLLAKKWHVPKTSLEEARSQLTLVGNIMQ